MINLYPHQEKVLDDTYERKNVAYYLDMGLGKTFVGSEKLWELNTPYNLVVVPASQVQEWCQHFNKFYNEYYTVIKYDKRVEIPPESVVVISYDRLWRRPELANLTNYTLMLDESSMIQNDQSKRSKFILENLQPDNVILLSGTPTGGKYEKLWSQMKLLGWDIDKWHFHRRYTEAYKNANWGGWTVTGYKNVDNLKKKMDEYGAVFMKTDEVFELPDQNYIEVKIPQSPEYKNFEKHRVIHYQGQRIKGDTSAGYQYGMMLFGGAYSKNKIARLKEMLESTDDRLIIFYTYKQEFEVLKKMVKSLKKPMSYINGDGVDKKNYETKSDSVTLVQYQSGAMGHNLQLANKIIYFSPTNNPEHWMQSLKRVHRIGQDRPVFYYLMETVDSVDTKRYESVKLGQAYTDELFKKDYKWEGK